MTSVASTIEAIAYEALQSVVTEAPVHQHVPEDTPYPYVVIGGLVLRPFGGKGDDPDREGELVIGAVFKGEERKPLMQLQDQIEEALTGLTVTKDGWTVSLTFRESRPNPPEEEEAELYIGTSEFGVIALTD